MDDEFWPSDGESDGDEADLSLKGLADEGAVQRILEAHDYFDVLNLPRDCSSKDVKRSFFKLSKEVHPDKNGARNANQAFDLLMTAKTTLSEPADRDAYASAHPPKASQAREWARSMDANGRARWSRAGM